MTATDERLRRPREAAVEWWRDAVVYENHLPSLRDGNGDGIGDLEGLIQSLDYLGGTLGVDAIWVGPCYRSPLLDQGFDVTDFRDIEPTFGDLPTFDRLIEEAHRRGLKIIVDYIPNHTSDQHPWFLEARASRDNPKRDWYVWADPAPDGGPPNNWTAEIGGSTWELDEATGQYYLHTHLREQPDLNWRNPEVRAEMLDVLRFWLARGADGVRIDVAHVLMKDPQLRDSPPARKVRPTPSSCSTRTSSRSCTSTTAVIPTCTTCWPRSAACSTSSVPWASRRSRRWSGTPGPSTTARTSAACTSRSPSCSSRRRGGPTRCARSCARSRRRYRMAWPVRALSNHDRSRLASRIGRAQARIAAVLLFTLRGTPVCLYGDELGMIDQAVPRDRQRDHFGFTDGGVSHDPARTPMPWNDGRNGGFSTADESGLWLPACVESATINVDAQLGDPASILNLYRALLALRKRSDAVRRGTYAEHPAGDEHCLVYVRAAAGERMLVALNLTGEAREVALAEEAGEVVLTTGLDRAGERVAGELRVGPDEGVIVALA
jgi:alpha-glucosidase